MKKAHINIYTDMDFHVIAPNAQYGYDTFKHTIGAESEEELRNNLVFFLAQIEIRLPWEQEYNPWRSDKHDAVFKHFIYEAIHQIASGGEINFHIGGNYTLDISH